jgi:hypothetical protein
MSEAAVDDAFKDMVKATISLPLEGCKSMGLGCVQVAGIYGATLTFALPEGSSLNIEEFALLLVPFFLFAYAGFLFGTGYLPNKTLNDLIASETALSEANQRNRLFDRERHIRSHLNRGSFFFWVALTLAIMAVVAVRAYLAPAAQ